MKKAVIFDQDGLMFDTETLYSIAWKNAALKMGREASDQFCEEIRGTSGEKLKQVVEKHIPGIDVLAFHELCLSLVHDLMDEALAEKPGLHELLAYLKGHGYKMAVASSSAYEQIEKNLLRADIKDYFDFVISGKGLERGKPAPDIFIAAAKGLGVNPKDCYVLEDSPSGVRAGHTAGCHTIMVPDLIKPTKELAQLYDACCASLLDVIDYIDKDQD